jgi:hypothetical protein
MRGALPGGSGDVGSDDARVPIEYRESCIACV